MIATKCLIVLLGLCAPFAVHAQDTMGWVACPRADKANLPACIEKSMANFIPLLKLGFPQIGVTPLDPLPLADLDFSTKDTLMTYKNVKMMNMFTDMKITRIEADPDNYVIRVVYSVPDLTSEGDYEVKGDNVLGQPVTGSGKATQKYVDCSIDITLTGTSTERDGVKYMNLEQVKTVYNPAKVITEATNLFGGDKEKSDNYHKLMAEKWKAFFELTKPLIENAVSASLKSSLSALFLGIPYDKIFP